MYKNKIVHIIILDKFIPPFIDFINENFDASEHCFVILGKERYKFGLTKEHDVVWIDSIFKLFSLAIGLNSSRKIIIHGLWSQIFNMILFMQPWLLKKSYWIIWGGDLYSLREKNISVLQKLLYFIKKKIIKRMKGIICYHESEYRIAKSLGNAEGEFFQSFFYPSNLFKPLEIKKKRKDIIKIQIGNSADPSNKHIEVLQYLKKYKKRNILLILPLSYGDREYANEVIKIGKNIFGSKFYALEKYMNYNEYIDFLNEIDIAIFNHDRQQAMGNITTLLGLGKKVYINKEVITWNYLKEIGIEVFDVNNIDLHLIDTHTKKNNIVKIQKFFSLSNLVKQWKKILESS